MLQTLRRLISFTDWNASHPGDQPPGDMLDASFDAIYAAISDLETKLLEIRRDDGSLVPQIVGIDAVKAEIFEKTLHDVRQMVATDLQQAILACEEAKNAKAAAEIALQEALEARDRAVEAKTGIDDVRNSALGAAIAMRDEAQASIALLEVLNAETRTAVDDWDDAESSAQAWAESSQMWAEYMPDTLPDNALKVMDITGDHWSSRWWANQAANAFGMLTSLYLGVHSEPPTTNNNGGPIETGSIYYDSDDHQPYVWTGSSWEPFYAGVNRSGIATLWYEATAGQTAFPLTAMDLQGRSWTLTPGSPEQVDPHVNGIKLMPINDFVVDAPSSTVTFQRPLRAGDMVAVDVLMPVEQLSPGAVQAYSLKPLVGIDGTKKVFDLETKIVPSVPVNVVSYEELVVSLDGVVQEPGISFTAVGSQITFVTAPSADSYVFLVWSKSVAGGGGGGGGGGSTAWADITGKPSTFPPTLPIAQSGVTNLVSDLAAKAPLASPALTGTPTAPTAATATSTTQIATTAHVRANVAALVGSASSGFDTLGEIENYIAANITPVLGNKADLFDPTFTGTPDVPTAAPGTNTTQIASTAFVAAAILAADDVSGGRITIAGSAPSSPSVNDVWIDTT